jgi:hypothetical protein
MGAHLLFWKYVYRKLQTGGFNLNKLLDTKAVYHCQPLNLPCSARVAFLKHQRTPNAVIFDLDSLLCISTHSRVCPEKVLMQLKI